MVMLHKATLKGSGESFFLFATARCRFKGFSRVLSFLRAENSPEQG